MKEFNPIKVSVFPCDCGINMELAFQWWVPYTFRKWDHIITAINLCAKIMHEYGIEIPCTVANTLKTNEENDNIQWCNNI